MRAEIISIGDELLIGQTINTNAGWMGEQLNSIGIDVIRVLTISDKKDDILNAIKEAEHRSEIVLITGGLGPTKDDITKHTLCEYFGTRLVRNQQVLARIEAFFTQRGRTMLEVNRQQADLPESCTVLDNLLGTASGMWFEKSGKVVVSLPGVPYEMKHLMEEQVIPKLKNTFALPFIVHRTILTQGIGESFLAERISDWENELRKEDLSLAYLPSPGIVKLRITAKGENETKLRERVQYFEKKLLPQIEDVHYGFEKDKLEEIVGKLLLERKATLATAESCTGGFIAHRITSVSGSSDYFLGSVISYANAVKMAQLGVTEDDLIHHGAVSEPVVVQMVKGVIEKIGSDYAISVSGVAGPNGGTEEKPVGMVWIAVGNKERVYARKFYFEKDRDRNILRSSLSALMLLRKFLLGQL
jgi:nicotinamide-nucleotide amidase